MFTLLVNSSDGFEDCWEPFFTLLGRHWPRISVPILLNTERKDRQPSDRLPVQCSRVQPPAAPRLTWIECLLAAPYHVKRALLCNSGRSCWLASSSLFSYSSVHA